MMFKVMKKFIGLVLILMLTLLPAAPPEKALHAETWYFEGMFNNGYSMVFIITLFSSDGNTGIALEGLYIYREGHLEITERKSSFSFDASDEIPLVEISVLSMEMEIYFTTFLLNQAKME